MGICPIIFADVQLAHDSPRTTALPDVYKRQEVEAIFRLNVFSAWKLCKLVVPHMARAGYGSIVNITSMASINKSPNMSAYASSKAVSYTHLDVYKRQSPLQSAPIRFRDQNFRGPTGCRDGFRRVRFSLVPGATFLRAFQAVDDV